MAGRLAEVAVGFESDDAPDTERTTVCAAIFHFPALPSSRQPHGTFNAFVLLSVARFRLTFFYRKMFGRLPAREAGTGLS